MLEPQPLILCIPTTLEGQPPDCTFDVKRTVG
jgi:hypothetical protein